MTRTHLLYCIEEEKEHRRKKTMKSPPPRIRTSPAMASGRRTRSGMIRVASLMIPMVLFFFFLHHAEIYWFHAGMLSIDQTPATQRAKNWKPGFPRTPFKKNQTGIITCDSSQERFDICFINGPTRMDPNTKTFLLMDTQQNKSTPFSQRLSPHPRKWEKELMASITELTVTTNATSNKNTTCDEYHDEPALVFSTGGYAGNLFHDFNDGLIPLFITSRFMEGSFVFVISEFHNWWIQKYHEVLHHHSAHKIINLDNETSTHCFNHGAVVGLISHDDMTIDPSLMPNVEDMSSFRAFLGESYAKKHRPFQDYRTDHGAKPVLVMVVRNGSRSIKNQAEVIGLAEQIGFVVQAFMPTKTTNLNEAFRLVNTSHAMMGVHGAGLTHFMFLRPGSVLLQVIPLGAEWVSETYFGRPARAMGVKYVPYRIDVSESSLVDKYDRNDIVLRDPSAVVKRNWMNTKHIYLEPQNVKLDLLRLRRYMDVMYRFAKRFMKRNG